VFRPDPLLKSNLFIVNYEKKTIYLNNSVTRGDLQVIRLRKVTIIKYKASVYLIRDSPLLEQVEGRNPIYYPVYKNSRSRVFLDKTFYRKPLTGFKSRLFNYYIDFKH
jgi:hypothetical protein